MSVSDTTKKIILPSGHDYMVDPAVGPYHGGWGGWAALMMALVPTIRPSIAVEIGVWYGTTTACIASVLPPGGILYALDMQIQTVAREIIEAWSLSDRVVFIEGDSRQTVHTLPDGIGFAFIDGNHEPDGVQADFDGIWPKMAPNGLIVFHDVSGYCGVRDWLPQRFPESAVPGVVYLPYGMGFALLQKGPRAIIRADDGNTTPWPT